MTREEHARGDALLERLQATERARAMVRLRDVGVASLTHRELQLLGAEVIRSHRRREQHAAEQRQRDAARRDAVVTALTPNGIVWREPMLERLNQHIVTLCLEHGISVVRTYDTPHADQEGRVIHVPPVTSEQRYATALHEIAHVVDPAADSRQFSNVTEQDGDHTWLLSAEGEAGAWAWASRHALEWTPVMQERSFSSLKNMADRLPRTSGERARLVDAVHCGWTRTRGDAWSCTEFGERIKALRGSYS